MDRSRSEGEKARRVRILAVEDEATIRRFYERFFEAHDMDVVLAPTGNAAMEIIESGRDFDVILLDVRLPGLSGRAIWKLLQLKRPELCARVLIVTGDILGKRTRELIESTGRPHLEKPFATSDLLAAISRILQQGGEGQSEGCVGE